MKILRILRCMLRIAEEGAGGHGPLIDHGDWLECGNCGWRTRKQGRCVR